MQNTYLHSVNLLPVRCIYMQIHRPPHSANAPAQHTDYAYTVRRYTHTHMCRLTGSHPLAARPAVSPPRQGEGDGGMSHWSGAQSFWQRHKVSQQVTAGCLSAREGVTSHRETTSLICHFRSISQRKRRREGETDIGRKRKRERGGLWSTTLCDLGWWNHGWTDWKMLALWIGDCVTIMCVCVPAFLSHLINNLWVIQGMKYCRVLCQRVSSQILKIPLKTFWCRSLEHTVHFKRGLQWPLNLTSLFLSCPPFLPLSPAPPGGAARK